MWSCNRDHEMLKSNSQYLLPLEILEIMCCRTSSIRSSESEVNFCFLDFARLYYTSPVRELSLSWVNTNVGLETQFLRTNMQARNVWNFVVVAIIPATVIPTVHHLVHVKQWTSTKVRSRATEIILETP